MSFFEPQTEPPPIYRSGRLQEEQRLVAKTCSFFWRILLPQCPNFAELESSKEAKSYHENPCNRITCKNLPPPSPRSTWIAVPGWGENKKRPLARFFPDKRSSQRALHRPKGDVRGKWNVPTETRSVDSWMKRSLRRHLRAPGCLPFEKLIPLRLRGCW